MLVSSEGITAPVHANNNTSTDPTDRDMTGNTSNDELALARKREILESLADRLVNETITTKTAKGIDVDILLDTARKTFILENPFKESHQ